MHKKLLLVMLVPILAFSMVVIGCGSDDGVFDGAENYHRVQGVWYANSTSDIMEEMWFVLTGNQATASDALGATGVATRTDFTFGVGAGQDARYLGQRTFRDDVLRRIVDSVNALPAGDAAAIAHRTAVRTNLTSTGVGTTQGSGADTTWIVNPHAVWDNIVDAATLELTRAPTLTLPAEILEHRAYLELDRIVNDAFAAALAHVGVPIHRTLAEERLILELVEHTQGFPQTLFVAAQLGELSREPNPPATPPNAERRLFADPGSVNAPISLVPFRITFYTFDPSNEAGSIFGFWAEWGRDDLLGDQSIVVLNQRVAQVVQNLLIPHIGAYGRAMPQTP